MWKPIRFQGNELLGQLKQVVHDINARRVVIKQGERIVAEFPSMTGVIWVAFAPILTAIGALVALLKDVR